MMKSDNVNDSSPKLSRRIRFFMWMARYPVSIFAISLVTVAAILFTVLPLILGVLLLTAFSLTTSLLFLGIAARYSKDLIEANIRNAINEVNPDKLRKWIKVATGDENDFNLSFANGESVLTVIQEKSNELYKESLGQSDSSKVHQRKLFKSQELSVLLKQSYDMHFDKRQKQIASEKECSSESQLKAHGIITKLLAYFYSKGKEKFTVDKSYLSDEQARLFIQSHSLKKYKSSEKDDGKVISERTPNQLAEDIWSATDEINFDSIKSHDEEIAAKYENWKQRSLGIQQELHNQEQELYQQMMNTDNELLDPQAVKLDMNVDHSDQMTIDEFYEKYDSDIEQKDGSYYYAQESKSTKKIAPKLNNYLQSLKNDLFEKKGIEEFRFTKEAIITLSKFLDNLPALADHDLLPLGFQIKYNRSSQSALLSFSRKLLETERKKNVRRLDICSDLDADVANIKRLETDAWYKVDFSYAGIDSPDFFLKRLNRYCDEQFEEVYIDAQEILSFYEVLKENDFKFNIRKKDESIKIEPIMKKPEYWFSTSIDEIIKTTDVCYKEKTINLFNEFEKLNKTMGSDWSASEDYKKVLFVLIKEVDEETICRYLNAFIALKKMPSSNYCSYGSILGKVFWNIFEDFTSYKVDVFRERVKPIHSESRLAFIELLVKVTSDELDIIMSFMGGNYHSEFGQNIFNLLTDYLPDIMTYFKKRGASIKNFLQSMSFHDVPYNKYLALNELITCLDKVVCKADLIVDLNNENSLGRLGHRSANSYCNAPYYKHLKTANFFLDNGYHNIHREMFFDKERDKYHEPGEETFEGKEVGAAHYCSSKSIPAFYDSAALRGFGFVDEQELQDLFSSNEMFSKKGLLDFLESHPNYCDESLKQHIVNDNKAKAFLKAKWLHYIAYNTQCSLTEAIKAWQTFGAWRYDDSGPFVTKALNYATSLPFSADKETKRDVEIQFNLKNDKSVLNGDFYKAVSAEGRQNVQSIEINHYEMGDLDDLMNRLALTDEHAKYLRESISKLNDLISSYSEYEDFNQFGKDVLSQFRTSRDSHEQCFDEIEFLAALRHAVFLYTGGQKWLRLEQISAVLLSLKQGALFQVDTSEGKTLIMQCIAITRAMQKQKVDILTHAEEYAKQDCDNMVMQLGRKLGLSVCSRYKGVLIKEKAKEAFINADIFYVDVNQKILDDIYDDYYGNDRRHADCILIDEGDNILLDVDANTTMQLAKPPEEEGDEADSLIDFLNGLNKATEQLLSEEAMVSDILEYYKAQLQSFSYVKNFSETVWQRWISAAITCTDLKRNEDYTLAKNEEELFEVHIMHKTTSGREDKRSQWSGGIHQLIAARENARLLNLDEEQPKVFIPPLSQVYAESNVANYLTRNDYKTYFVYTGTLGDESLQQYMKDLLDIKDVYHFPRAKRAVPHSNMEPKKRYYDLYYIDGLFSKLSAPEISGNAIVISKEGKTYFVHDGIYLLDTRGFDENNYSLYSVKLEKDDIEINPERLSAIELAKVVATEGKSLEDYTFSDSMALLPKDKKGKFQLETLHNNDLDSVLYLIEKAKRLANENLLVEQKPAWPKVTEGAHDGKTETYDCYNRRFDYMPMFAENTKDHFAKILTAIRDARKQQYASILFFETIEECNQFNQFLGDNGIEDIQILDDTHPGGDDDALRPPEKVILSKAQDPGMVTLTTAAGGRATDFSGIDVGIVTKPALQRILHQELGRLARNGRLAITYQIYDLSKVGQVSIANEGSRVSQMNLSFFQAQARAGILAQLQDKKELINFKAELQSEFLVRLKSLASEQSETLKSAWEKFYPQIDLYWQKEHSTSSQDAVKKLWQEAFKDTAWKNDPPSIINEIFEDCLDESFASV